MLTKSYRQSTLNICNAGVYELDVIFHGAWYHESDNLDNEYTHRGQTLLYPDLYKEILVKSFHEIV